MSDSDTLANNESIDTLIENLIDNLTTDNGSLQEYFEAPFSDNLIQLLKVAGCGSNETVQRNECLGRLVQLKVRGLPITMQNILSPPPQC